MTIDRNQLPVLSRQLEGMSARAEAFRSREQEERDWFGAVLESLECTRALLQRGVDPRSSTLEFVVEAAGDGRLQLKQADLPVPIDEEYLRHVFETIGIDLVPGQLVVLDPRMAKWAIEESLWGLELERALSGPFGGPAESPLPAVLGAWSRKRDLVMANRIAEELLERGTPSPLRIPRAV